MALRFASAVNSARETGEPISSSELKIQVMGRSLRSPRAARALRAKMPATIPPFMSTTPGP